MFSSKILKYLLALLLIVLSTAMTQGQNIPEPAPIDKAVVYFVRPLGIAPLKNFTFFDGEKLIGRFGGRGYIRYQCEPGKRIFWAQSVNKSFVKANVAAGKIYMIEAVPMFARFAARVDLYAVDPQIDRIRHFQKLLATKEADTFTAEDLENIKRYKEGVFKQGINTYKRKTRNAGFYQKLKSDMFFEIEDLVFKKKEKKRNTKK